MKIRDKFAYHYFILVLLAFVVLAYSQGLHGPFVLDDYENIILNQPISVHNISRDTLRDALWSNDSGPLKRPLAAVSFALNYYLAGGFESSFWFKFTNLCLHLTNTILVYLLALAITRTPALAKKLRSRERRGITILAAALWALHPIQLTSVLYVVQRMNSMSALFVLSGLIVFCHGRQLLEKRDGKAIPIMFGGILIGLVLGMASKENAALLPLYALTIEYTFYQRAQLDTKTRNAIYLFYVVTVLIPIIVFMAYLAGHPNFLEETYLERDFTISERLMTETRVLWLYLSLILIPDVHRLSLFHDDIPTSITLVNPPSTLPSILGICALLLFAVIKSKRYPIAGFAILWFLCGHVLESSILGLEIAHEHRNYLPAFGILFGVSYSANYLQNTAANLKKIILFLSFLLVLAFAIATWSMARVWNDAYSLAEYTVRNHPDSPRANDMASRVNLENGNVGKSIHYLRNGARVSPNEVGFRIDMYILIERIAHEVNDEVVRAVKNGTDLDQINIEGLPSDYTKTMNNGVLRLSLHDDAKDEIKALLKDKAIDSHGIMSLDLLHDCILTPPHVCASLYDKALDWFTTAAANNKTPPEYQALILADTAALFAWKRNYDRALEYINPATQAAPDRLYYRLLKTEYLIHLERSEEAIKLLNQVEKDISRYRLQLRSHQDMYDNLRERLKMHEHSGQPS